MAYAVAVKMDVPKASRKQRNRVPISCLNCKKRKVKCDKVKPACGGCVKNQVAHLCHYIEPAWAETPTEKQDGADELVLLKAVNEKVISQQQREIELLKRQLQLQKEQQEKQTHGPEPPGLSMSTLADSRQITILHKLNPEVNEMREAVEITNDDFLSFKPHAGRGPLLLGSDRGIHIYSWLNIIKLDPQLTGLWFKITNLQKVYHTYKMKLISTKNTSPGPGTGSPRRKPKFKINEIDFTYSLSPGISTSTSTSMSTANTGDGIKCPVVECDFNFMADDLNTRAATPKNLDLNIKPEDMSPLHKFYLFSDDSAGLLKKIQGLWEATVNLARGDDKLSGGQMSLLLDFYFNSRYDETESSHLLTFFRQEIALLVRNENDVIFLNLNIQSQSQEASFALLKIKGTFLCLLALIVEESLDILRQRLENGASDDSTQQFRLKFPSELFYAGLGYKENNVLLAVQDYVCHVNSHLGPFYRSPQLNLSLALVVACVAVLNRLIALYRRAGSFVDSKQCLFANVFKFLLTMVQDSDGGVKIWKDPALISFTGAPESRQAELRLLLCHVWNDFVRLTNMVCFDFISLVKSENDLNKLVIQVYSKIEEAETNLYHTRYLEPVPDVDHLKTSLQVNYLISRSFTVLYCGVCQFGDVCLTVSILARLMKEAATWAHDPALAKLKYTRYFEFQCMLQYIEFYIAYLCLLQSEESQNDGISQKSFLEMLVKSIDFNRQLQKFITYDQKNLQSQYILLAVTETLGRLIQLIVGLLIRLKVPSENGILIYSNVRNVTITVKAAVRDDLVKHTDDTLSMLNHSLLSAKRKVTKLSKLWNFYLTFIKNSQKMNPLGYAKIHADISAFSSMDKLMDKCPVNTHDQVEIKQELAERISRCPVESDDYPAKPVDEISAKCPVDHESRSKCPVDRQSRSKCPVDHEYRAKCPIDHESRGKCPVDHRNRSKSATAPAVDPFQAKDELRKRKCPFDHDAMKFMPKTFLESHVRGSDDYKKPRSPRFQTPPPAPLVTPQPMAPPMEVATPSTMGIMPPTKPVEMTAYEPLANLNVNLNDFPNFDLDFLQNEAWFEQLGQGELETPALEGFFQ